MEDMGEYQWLRDVADLVLLLGTAAASVLRLKETWLRGWLMNAKPRQFEVVVSCLASASLFIAAVKTTNSARLSWTRDIEIAKLLLTAFVALANALFEIWGLLKWRKSSGLGTAIFMFIVASFLLDERERTLVNLAAVANALSSLLLGDGDASNIFEYVSSPALDFMHLSEKRRAKFGGDGKVHVVVVTLGSRGDVQPFVALGQALEKTGKARVTIITVREYRDLVEQYGLAFRECGLEKLQLDSSTWRDSKSAKDLIVTLRRQATEVFRELGESVYHSSKDCDVLICTNVTCTFCFDIAEKLEVACWTVKFFPEFASRAIPPAQFKSSKFGIVNLLLWYWNLVGILIALWRNDPNKGEKVQVDKDPVGTFRKEVLEIPPLKGGKRFTQMKYSPTLCAYSSSIFPKASDAPVSAFTTGWWFVQSDGEDVAMTESRLKTKEKLDSFLQNGESKPLCINFGSMTECAKDLKLVNTTLSALSTIAGGSQSLKIVIVDSKFTEEEVESYIQNYPLLQIHVLKEIPHEFLFPFCSAIVHHGGSGTTARAAQFGVPSLIIPIMVWTDQPMWANRMEELCAGIHVNRFGSNFQKEMVDALVRLVRGDSKLLQGSKALQESLAKEDRFGADRAAEKILGRFIF